MTTKIKTGTICQKHPNRHASSFPWCFCFLGVFVPGNFLGLFECCLLILQGFLSVRMAGKILDVFEVFLGVFEKTKEKKDRVHYESKSREKIPRFSQQALNVGAQTEELEIRRKAAGKRHFPAMQLFQCCSAVFCLLQRSFW